MKSGRIAYMESNLSPKYLAHYAEEFRTSLDNLFPVRNDEDISSAFDALESLTVSDVSDRKPLDKRVQQLKENLKKLTPEEKNMAFRVITEKIKNLNFLKGNPEVRDNFFQQQISDGEYFRIVASLRSAQEGNYPEEEITARGTENVTNLEENELEATEAEKGSSRQELETIRKLIEAKDSLIYDKDFDIRISSALKVAAETLGLDELRRYSNLFESFRVSKQSKEKLP